MRTIQVDLGRRAYPIHIGKGLLDDRSLFDSATAAQQILIVSNEKVAPLYLDRVRRALGERKVATVILPDGEKHKTLETFGQIIDALVGERFHRDACLVALGGGVVGDVAGFAAASYQRGIDFLQIPTTLLAQVDSSVGGKTAVNHREAKNMIGAFHQPIAVLTDLATLETLPHRELAAGLAEVIKYGLIEDAGFFDWLDEHLESLLALDASALAFAIGRSCEIKAAVVAEDERERGRRALLNLGHTFGHAIEALAGYGTCLHGEAVAIGTLMAARVSESLGLIAPQERGRIESLYARAGLPTEARGIDADHVLDRMQLDKKTGSSGVRVVLLQGLGRAEVVPAPDTALLRAAVAAQTGS